MLPRTKIMVFLLIVSSIVLLSRPLTLVNAKNVEITENPSLKENFQLVDRESFNSEFETILTSL